MAPNGMVYVAGNVDDGVSLTSTENGARSAETGVFSESVTLMPMFGYVAAVVGVPVTAPVDAFRLRPDGRVPEYRVKVYGAAPPDTTGVKL